MNTAQTIILSFSHLFFPHHCAGCGSDIISEEQLLCAHCSSNLPYTVFENIHNNPIEKNFWGRVSILNATSLLHFTKDSVLQNLLHQFKYKGKKEIGLYFGRLIGNSILKSERFKNIDALIPLPLFISKEKRRGYNQSTILCEGVAEVLHLPVWRNVIVRAAATETQTHKNRIERWENINGKFEVKDFPFLKNKHVLLVDDVVTTGATIEACASQLLLAENVTVSVATLAYTLM